MPGRGGGNRPMVKVFGTENHRRGAGAGKSRGRRSRATRWLLFDRRGPTGARAGDERQRSARGTVAPMASYARGGRVLRKHFPADSRDGGRASSFQCRIGSLADTRAAGISAALARERAGGTGRELFRDLAPATAGLAENVLQKRRHSR